MVETIRFKKPLIAYDSRDQVAIRADMIRSIPFFTPEWTDHNPTDFGIVQIELFAGMADGLHFYVDRTLFEGYWGTAITREAYARLGKMIDFELRGPTASSVEVEFTIAAVLGGDLLIPKGTQISTTGADPIFFETVDDATIVGGQLSVVASVREGKSETLTDFVSDGTENQKFLIDLTDVIETSLQVEVDEGAGFDPWTEQDSLFLSGTADAHFTTERDGEDKITLIFGDNSTGRIPDVGALIRPFVRRGGGKRGNVGAETINAVVSQINYLANPVAVSVTNALEATGGEDPMGVLEARRQGPRSFRTLERAVTARDYEDLAEGFPGVVKARATEKLVGTGISGCCCGVTIAIAVEGGGPPSEQLKSDLQAYLFDRAMIGTCVEIGEAEIVHADAIGTVYVGSAFSIPDMQEAVDAAVADFFSASSEAVAFGTPIFLSDFMRLIDEIPGVDHVDLEQLTRRPEPTLEQWNGTGTFSSVDVGRFSVDEVWTVTFVTPTTFTVRGTVSGLQGNQGVVDVPYFSDNNEVSFTVVSALTPQLAGDFAQFRTSPKVANVPVDPNEVAEQGTTSFEFVSVPRPGRIC